MNLVLATMVGPEHAGPRFGGWLVCGRPEAPVFWYAGMFIFSMLAIPAYTAYQLHAGFAIHDYAGRTCGRTHQFFLPVTDIFMGDAGDFLRCLHVLCALDYRVYVDSRVRGILSVRHGSDEDVILSAVRRIRSVRIFPKTVPFRRNDFPFSELRRRFGAD